MGRGRPRLTEDEHSRRRALYPNWATQIKKNSGLTDEQLEEQLAGKDAGGRLWRYWMSGERIPNPELFRTVTRNARTKGWLKNLEYLGACLAKCPHESEDQEAEGMESLLWDQHALGQCYSIVSDALLLASASARLDGYDKNRFLTDVRNLVEKVVAHTWVRDADAVRESWSKVAPQLVKDLQSQWMLEPPDMSGPDFD